MDKNILRITLVAMVLCFALTTISYSAEGQTTGQKAKTFWQKLFNYPADVTQETVKTAAQTGEQSAAVVTDTVKVTGKVTSGDANPAELVTVPVNGMAKTVANTAKSTVDIPAAAAKKEETPKANQ